MHNNRRFSLFLPIIVVQVLVTVLAAYFVVGDELDPLVSHHPLPFCLSFTPLSLSLSLSLYSNTLEQSC